MIALRLAAMVAALTTVTLNAHFGYTSTSVVEYAILFAVLNATLDLAKCSCLVGMNAAWQHRHVASAGLLFLVFWPLLAWSLFCGLSEVALSKGTAADRHIADTQARTRAEAEHARLTRELATMQANATFTATAACALPKSNTAREFCASVTATKAALAAAETKIAAKTTTDPQPHLTLLATVTGKRMEQVQFTVALVPVLLAELVGSVGFFLSGRAAPKAPKQPVQRRWWLRATKSPPSIDTAPAASQEALAAPSKPVVPVNGATPPRPTLTWTIPKPS